MAETFDTILKGATIVNHDGTGQRDIGIRNGRIAAIGSLGQASAGEVIDCTGLHILPGVVDSQVHFREPGLEHKEDLETGSRAAVLGGVTSVFEMPNTKPLTTTVETLEDKIRRGRHRMHCDFAFWIGGTRDNAKDVGELERLPGAAGIKVFMGSSTGDLLVEDDDGVRSILKNTRRRASSSVKVCACRAIRPATRSGATRLPRCNARNVWCALRMKPARAFMCCTSLRLRKSTFCKRTRTLRPAKRRRIT
jgi:dihydroorotase